MIPKETLEAATTNGIAVSLNRIAETRLTTEQIARVFAMYIGQMAQFDSGNRTTIEGVLIGHECVTVFDDTSKYSLDSCNYRIRLRPISAITDEDAVEVAKIAMYDPRVESYSADEVHVDDIIRTPKKQKIIIPISMRCWEGRIEILNGKHIRCIEDDDDGEQAITSLGLIYQYLIQQGYAVPIYVAPGHPDNDKTAIELGLAIDSAVLPK